jgi:hypothetical protein
MSGDIVPAAAMDLTLKMHLELTITQAVWRERLKQRLLASKRTFKTLSYM